MAKRAPQPATGRVREKGAPRAPAVQATQLPPANPPRKRRGFLIVAALAWLAWVFFLVAMALR